MEKSSLEGESFFAQKKKRPSGDLNGEARQGNLFPITEEEVPFEKGAYQMERRGALEDSWQGEICLLR